MTNPDTAGFGANNYPSVLPVQPEQPADMEVIHDTGLEPYSDPTSLGRFRSAAESIKHFVKKRRMSLALGATAVSLGVGIAANPIGDTIDKVETAAPWVIPTAVGLDAAIGAGATMMVASAYGKVSKNPFKAKTYLKDLPQHANNSRLFKTGFVVTTVAGVGWGGVTTGAILATLPPESWGAMAFPAIDMIGTVVLRREIWQGIKRAAENEEPAPVDQ